MMPARPKLWLLDDQDERFKVYHYEAPEGSGSRLWIDLRGNMETKLFTRIRSNALGDGKTWIPLRPPQANYAVAKRRAFEFVARAAVPI
jgi:hypothetical protein